MKYLKHFANAQEAQTVLATWPFNTVSSIEGVQGVSINLGVPPVPAHDYVEIGGIKWATMNIGAESEGDPGLYFQWGSTHGYPEGQSESYLYWGTCPYSINGSNSNFSKYNINDGKITLDLEDDAVHAAWGGNWRMPTNDEFQALLNATNAALVVHGIYGMELTDKSDNTKKLFIPCGGQMFGYNVSYKASASSYSGCYGNIWTSTLMIGTGNKVNDAYYYNCGYSSKNYTIISKMTCYDRQYGYNCRGILDE